MTIHSSVDYKCEFCDTYFVPLAEAPNCPRCDARADTIYDDFVWATLDSALFNLRRYHSVFPPAWSVGTIGDHYYLNAFLFLSFVCSEVPVSKRKILKRVFSQNEIDTLTTKFVGMTHFGDESYRMNGFKVYFTLLLSNPLPW